ncbi:MAG: hypothetical protein MPL62_09845 [Alphaproteobacteria bacterium]|nr:hypothetical protein [Alphaproteobacteria bacterium]
MPKTWRRLPRRDGRLSPSPANARGGTMKSPVGASLSTSERGLCTRRVRRSCWRHQLTPAGAARKKIKKFSAV